jgi:hypothetical protein
MPVPGANEELDVICIRCIEALKRQTPQGVTASQPRKLSGLPKPSFLVKPLNENIVQTHFRGIMSARCTPEL